MTNEMKNALTSFMRRGSDVFAHIAAIFDHTAQIVELQGDALTDDEAWLIWGIMRKLVKVIMVDKNNDFEHVNVQIEVPRIDAIHRQS